MKNASTLPPDAAKLALAPATLTCYHCHDECPDDRLHLGDKHFCCEGCQMVYEILNENDLCQYYSLDEKAGNSLRNRRDARAYAWLDDEDVKAKLIRFTDGHTTRVDFYIPGMHCASCIWLLEHLYRLDGGVVHSKVNFLKKSVTIHFEEDKSSLRKLAALLSSIGYAPEINLGDVENTGTRSVDKSLYYKIGVAGFAFGNIMLLSFPEYLGLDRAHDGWFFGIFGYLNIILAIPVLLYSAQDYFKSAWQGIKNRHLNIDFPLAAGMAVLFGRSALEIFSGSGAGYMDSFAGLLFFLLTGKWFQQKTYHRLSFERDYKSYFPVAATVKRDNGEESAVPVNKLEPGDIIVVHNEELIPADGILLKGKARVDYAFVTGESDAVPVQSGERIFAGGKQLGERIEISLTRRISQSYLTQLWNDEAFKAAHKSHASLLADRAGRYFTTLILLVSSFAFLYWWVWRGELATAVNAASAVLIIACPCAVALSIPFTLGNVLRILGRNRFYVKNTQVIEAFSVVNAVVFDKTGTLTNISQNAVRFVSLASDSGKTGPLSNPEKTWIRSLARQSAHPRSRQIFESMPDILSLDVDHFEEIAGQGVRGVVQGKKVALGSASFIFGESRPEKGIFIQINGDVRGYFEVKSRLREGLKPVLEYFRQSGGGMPGGAWLLSGDNDRESAALAPYFADAGAMRFNHSPQDKLEFVKNLQSQGRNVLMFGDGLNDAGALRQSNVGVVVTENTNNFTPACDAILHAGAFERLPQLFRLSAAGMQLVNRAYLLAACYNVVGLSYAVSGRLSPVVAAILMPLSSVTIIVFGTLATNWKAWKLGLLDQNHAEI